jgi:hypothetical protein
MIPKWVEQIRLSSRFVLPQSLKVSTLLSENTLFAQKMHYPLIACAVLLATLSSCRRSEPARNDNVRSGIGQESMKAISLEYLDAHQKDFVDQEVVVAAFLCPHSEGPAIASNPKIPFKYSMGLVVAESSVIVSKDLTRHRWWYQDEEEGFPVILSGVFRIQDRKSRIPMDERIFRNPCIEVKRAEEVAIDNPVWSASRNKREHAVPSDGHKPSSRAPSDGPTEPADAL